MIAKSKDNLRLLVTLGYSPKWLAESVAKTWLPVYLFIIISALIITQGLHFLFMQLSFVNKEDVSFFLDWSVFVTAFILLLLTVYINSNLVKRELRKIV